MTRRGLYANTGRPARPVDDARGRAETSAYWLAQLTSLFARQDVEHPERGAAYRLGVATWHGRFTGRWFAYWTDAAGENHRTTFADTEGAAVRAAALAIRAGVPGPGVWFVARRRGVSPFEVPHEPGSWVYRPDRAETASKDRAGSRLDMGSGI